MSFLVSVKMKSGTRSISMTRRFTRTLARKCLFLAECRRRSRWTCQSRAAWWLFTSQFISLFCHLEIK